MIALDPPKPLEVSPVGMFQEDTQSHKPPGPERGNRNCPRGAGGGDSVSFLIP
ncbi:hypothetical protein I79_013253 [Cricetulus griseus]|uniref:Uncharacterized protein n=1 Tax=Cricetulus griseus TaxID=10029 RepID=G3HQZ4_CRIGR|nr:hypothetical protein I79_013253 [Cricetulus griseus]